MYLGESASLIRRVENLVVEDGEVESESETNGVGWGKLSGGDGRSSLV